MDESVGANTMDRSISRREALRSVAALVPLPWFLGMAQRAGRGWPTDPARAPNAGAAELPPRTVGLRSQGGGFRFDPPGLRIARGETVTWLNIGDFHTATAFHPANDHLLSASVPHRMPEAAEPFHSGMLGLTDGSVFEHEFVVDGVYDYFCQPHYGFGMVGRVVVGEGFEDAPYGDDSDLPERARRQLPSVGAITGGAGAAWEWASRLNGLLLLRTRGADLAPALRAIEEGVWENRALLDAFGTERVGRFIERLDTLATAVDDDVDYEQLVSRIDEAKAVLDPGAGTS